MRDLNETIARALADLQAAREREAAGRGMTLDELEAEETALRERRREIAEQRERDQARRAWVNQWRSVLPQVACEEIYDGKERTTDALRHVRAWLQSPKPCLILCGGVGTGKTYATAWACKQQWGEFVTAPALAKRFDPWKHEAASVDPLDRTAGLLVLDDLGTELDEPRFHQALFEIVNSRDAVDRRTLITTNLDISQIRPRYGDRIADRLNAMAKAVILKGVSLRKQGAGL
jgi:DNA replication protein DnaC